MTLAKPKPPSPRVTLVPLIDVLFILLVYFMVTSVYLDLDMIPAGGTTDDPQSNVPPTVTEAPQEGATLLLRITGEGQPVLRGQTLDPDALRASLVAALQDRPGLTVLILPSPVAPTQALATTLDVLAQAGVRDTRLIRIEAEP